jgi:hypothetical protein
MRRVGSDKWIVGGELYATDIGQSPLGLPVFEHPMFPNNTAGFEGFELPLRLGLIFDTTLAATRLIYSGVFERYPTSRDRLLSLIAASTRLG